VPAGQGFQPRRQQVTIIYLGRWLPNVSSGQPEGSGETGSLFPPTWPCSRRGLPGQTVTRLPVSSCLAISPLLYASGVFLLHFP